MLLDSGVDLAFLRVIQAGNREMDPWQGLLGKFPGQTGGIQGNDKDK